MTERTWKWCHAWRSTEDGNRYCSKKEGHKGHHRYTRSSTLMAEFFR